MAGTAQGNGDTSGYHVPDVETPGYSPGGDLNPAIGIEWPQGGSSGGLSRSRERHTVGSPAGLSQLMSPPISRFSFLGSGGRRAGAHPLFEFGETSTNRSLISPRGLQNTVESFQSIDEIKSVFIHQLTVEGGVIDPVRADHAETLRRFKYDNRIGASQPSFHLTSHYTLHKAVTRHGCLAPGGC
jgi:hypothetical protein